MSQKLSFLQSFLALDPIKFDGKSSLLVAGRWLKSVRRTFDAMRCHVEYNVSFVVHLVTEEPLEWWKTHEDMVNVENDMGRFSKLSDKI